MQRRLLGYLWFLSWFELYLEIFRHHHVTGALLLHPISWIFPTGVGAHPGDWLRGVLAGSILAPVAYGIVVVRERSHRSQLPGSDRRSKSQRFHVHSAVIVFGSMLVVLASVNQLIRRDPLTIDLTLRQGNGGFILLGGMLTALGLVLRHQFAESRIPRGHL
jgi:hypothetical protein